MKTEIFYKLGIFVTVFLLAFLFNACEDKELILENTSWYAYSFDDGDFEKRINPYLLEILPDNKLKFKLDVNNCFGSYEIMKNKEVEIKDMGCTEMCCDSDLALSFADMLAGKHMVRLEKDKLTLSRDGGKITFHSEMNTTEGQALSSIYLRTTGCFGPCPIYEIRIFENGMANYKGRRFVKTEGTHKLEFDKEAVSKIINEAQKLEFSQFEAEYGDKYISDAEYVYIEFNGKRVKVMTGAEAPTDLTNLISKVRSLVKSSGYIDRKSE
jgi:heat shock protein HslJ